MEHPSLVPSENEKEVHDLLQGTDYIEAREYGRMSFYEAVAQQLLESKPNSNATADKLYARVRKKLIEEQKQGNSELSVYQVPHTQHDDISDGIIQAAAYVVKGQIIVIQLDAENDRKRFQPKENRLLQAVTLGRYGQNEFCILKSGSSSEATSEIQDDIELLKCFLTPAQQSQVDESEESSASQGSKATMQSHSSGITSSGNARASTSASPSPPDSTASTKNVDKPKQFLRGVKPETLTGFFKALFHQLRRMNVSMENPDDEFGSYEELKSKILPNSKKDENEASPKIKMQDVIQKSADFLRICIKIVRKHQADDVLIMPDDDVVIEEKGGKYKPTESKIVAVANLAEKLAGNHRKISDLRPKKLLQAIQDQMEIDKLGKKRAKLNEIKENLSDDEIMEKAEDILQAMIQIEYDESNGTKNNGTTKQRKTNWKPKSLTLAKSTEGKFFTTKTIDDSGSWNSLLNIISYHCEKYIEETEICQETGRICRIWDSNDTTTEEQLQAMANVIQRRITVKSDGKADAEYEPKPTIVLVEEGDNEISSAAEEESIVTSKLAERKRKLAPFHPSTKFTDALLELLKIESLPRNITKENLQKIENMPDTEGKAQRAAEILHHTVEVISENKREVYGIASENKLELDEITVKLRKGDQTNPNEEYKKFIENIKKGKTAELLANQIGLVGKNWKESLEKVPHKELLQAAAEVMQKQITVKHNGKVEKIFGHNTNLVIVETSSGRFIPTKEWILDERLGNMSRRKNGDNKSLYEVLSDKLEIKHFSRKDVKNERNKTEMKSKYGDCWEKRSSDPELQETSFYLKRSIQVIRSSGENVIFVYPNMDRRPLIIAEDVSGQERNDRFFDTKDAGLIEHLDDMKLKISSKSPRNFSEALSEQVDVEMESGKEDIESLLKIKQKLQKEENRLENPGIKEIQEMTKKLGCSIEVICQDEVILIDKSQDTQNSRKLTVAKMGENCYFATKKWDIHDELSEITHIACVELGSTNIREALLLQLKYKEEREQLKDAERTKFVSTNDVEKRFAHAIVTPSQKIREPEKVPDRPEKEMSQDSKKGELTEEQASPGLKKQQATAETIDEPAEIENLKSMAIDELTKTVRKAWKREIKIITCENGKLNKKTDDRATEKNEKAPLVIAKSGGFYYPTKGDSKNLKAKWVEALFKVMAGNKYWSTRTTNPSVKRGDKKSLFNVAKIARRISYLPFLLAIVLGATASKSAFLVLLNAYTQNHTSSGCPLTIDESGDQHSYYLRFAVMLTLLLCLVLPDGMTLVYGFWRWVKLRGRKWPDVAKEKNFFFGSVSEILHAIGITFLTFSVWPFVDATLTISTFSLMALLAALASEIRKMAASNKYIKVFSIIGMIMMLIGFGLMSWLVYEQTRTIDNWKGKRTLIFVAAMLFVSTRYFHKFMNAVSEQPRSNQVDVQQTDANTPSGEETSMGGSDEPNQEYLTPIFEKDMIVIWSSAYSLVRIVIITGFTFLIHLVLENNELDDLGHVVSNPCWSVVASFRNAGLIQFFVGFGIFILGASACKAKMQGFAFCIALPLSMMLMTLSTYFCANDQYDFSESSSGFCSLLTGPNDYLAWKAMQWSDGDAKPIPILTVLFGILGTISLVFTTCYLWFEPSKVMLSIDDLFVKPIFAGPMISEEIMLCRREKMKKKKNTNDHSETTNQKSGANKQVYLCLTMWQEQRKEMMQIIRSILRLDKETAKSKNMNFEESRIYRMLQVFIFGAIMICINQVHVLFDGAITKNKKYKEGKTNSMKKFCVNEFVEDLMEILLKETGPESPIYYTPPKKGNLEKTGENKQINEIKPVRFETPYGGKIAFQLPLSGSTMVIHLKDNNLIRNKKRWSQCMYLNYILRFLKDEEPGFEIDNTYILALDGDVDFKPDGLTKLLKAMEKDDDDKRVAAACGRVHPLGAGPVAWFQIFEYAVGHWLQKTTEEVLGCVLCSPGCFTLFRGSVLAEAGVVEEYMSKSKTATHKVQWDQGEDRWLCTLLLKAGKRIEYVSTSDSKTYAPTRFEEFYNQRRRWAPSTLANTMDILLHRAKFREKNQDLTRAYMLYQFVLNIASVLGLSTVILIVQGALQYVFRLPAIWSLVLALVPVIFFVVICYTTSPKFQISTARFLTLIYALVMAGVMVAVVVQLASSPGGTIGPSLFTITMISLFLVIGLLHPTEIGCLIYGITYYLFVPSAFIFLPIYSYCNMHIVKWGTREAKDETNTDDGADDGLVGYSVELGTLCKCMVCLKKKKPEEKIGDLQTVSISGCRKTGSKNVKFLEHFFKTLAIDKDIKDPMGNFMGKNRISGAKETKQGQDKVEIYFEGPRGCRQNREISDSERRFWMQLIASDLYPESNTEKKINEKNLKPELESLKNRMSGTYLFLNTLWLALTFSIAQLLQGSVSPNIDNVNQPYEFNPLSFLFLLFFIVILAIQFCAMLVHRWGMYLLTLSEGIDNGNNSSTTNNQERENPSRPGVPESQRSGQQVASATSTV